MKPITIKILTKEFSINDIEKQLIYQYILANKLNYTKHPYLVDYLDGFIPSDCLKEKIAALNHTTLEEITNDMELLIPSKDKKTNGAFFTPAYIVDYIIKTVAPEINSKVIDLSCGSGAFIIGLLRYYTKTFGKSVVECVTDNIYGNDILEYNIKRCKILVMLYALGHNEIINEQDIHVFAGDSLKNKWNIKFDAVVGNPPYVKFQDLDEETRKYLFSNWETTKAGTYNLYFAFFELGLKVLKDNGKMGYITPNNYFTSLSGEYLRTFFQNIKCIYKILDFKYTKVFDVQTYTAITFINKRENETIEYGRISDNETPWEFLKKVNFTENKYTELSAKKWRLLCDEERENIYAIENSGEQLKSLFNIYVGIATLKDDAYTFMPAYSDGKLYYFAINGAEYKIEKEVTRPLVKISEMKNQEDVDNNKKRIIFPYYLDKENRPQLIEEDVFQSKYPNCFKYLLTKKDILAYRGKGNHIYSPFYQYGRIQTMNKRGKKLLTPTFSQYPRFLIDDHDDGLFINGYGIYPKEKYSEQLFSINPIALEENLDILQKILNSLIMDYYVKKTSVSIDGGYPCYQKNFIERFTIPEFCEDEIIALRAMRDSISIDNFLIKKYQVNLPSPNRCL